MSKYRLFKLAILFGILLAVFTAFTFAANPGLAATSAPQATEIVDGAPVPQCTAVVEGVPGMPVPATKEPDIR